LYVIFDIFHNDIELLLAFYYYQDEVAIVPLDRSRLHYVTDDVQALWGINFALGKNTVISYGPWADNQRKLLHKFFYPDEFQVCFYILIRFLKVPVI